MLDYYGLGVSYIQQSLQNYLILLSNLPFMPTKCHGVWRNLAVCNALPKKNKPWRVHCPAKFEPYKKLQGSFEDNWIPWQAICLVVIKA